MIALIASSAAFLTSVLAAAFLSFNASTAGVLGVVDPVEVLVEVPVVLSPAVESCVLSFAPLLGTTGCALPTSALTLI